MSNPFTDLEADILGSIENAWGEDPSPESGRTYCEGEDEYDAAETLKKRGFLRYVENGKHKGTKWAHFGLTDAGFKAAGNL